MNFQITKSAATAAHRPPTMPAADTLPQAGDSGAPAIPSYMITTVRNCQGLPTSELAELLNATPAEIDAIRALGPYCGEVEGWAGVAA